MGKDTAVKINESNNAISRREKFVFFIFFLLQLSVYVFVYLLADLLLRVRGEILFSLPRREGGGTIRKLQPVQNEKYLLFPQLQIVYRPYGQIPQLEEFPPGYHILLCNPFLP